MQRAVDGVGKLVHGDALVVIPVQRQGEHILLAKARGFAAGAAHALVLVGGVGVIPVFGHVGVNLVLADHDQIHPGLDHRPDDVGTPGQHVVDDLAGARQGKVGNLGRGHDGHPINVHILLVEATGRVAVPGIDQREERFRWRVDRRESSALRRWLFARGSVMARRRCRCVAVRRFRVEQVANEEVLKPALAIGSAHAMVGVGNHHEVKIFAGADQSVGQSKRRFRRHVGVHLADDQQQLAAQPMRVVDVRRLGIPGPHGISHPLLVP